MKEGGRIGAKKSHRQKKNRQKENYIKVGDVLVIHDEKIRRVQWKLARVVGLIEGKDGAVRGAVVRKLTDKKETCTEIRRPIKKLYLVELSDEIEEYTTKEGLHPVSEQKEDDRATREVAKKVQEKRRELIEAGLV